MIMCGQHLLPTIQLSPTPPQDIVSECLETFSEILEGLLVRPCDAYKDRVSKQNRELKILQYIEEKKKKDATEDTAMNLEEIPADGATIREVAHFYPPESKTPTREIGTNYCGSYVS
jgi:hypothetical protein